MKVSCLIARWPISNAWPWIWREPAYTFLPQIIALGQKSMTKLPMTAAGHAALENELNQRIGAERPRLIQRIQEAIADDANLAENSEY
jgi:transcription elongation factor-like protein